MESFNGKKYISRAEAVELIGEPKVEYYQRTRRLTSTRMLGQVFFPLKEFEDIQAYLASKPSNKLARKQESKLFP